MNRNPYTLDELNILEEAVDINAKLGRQRISKSTIDSLYSIFDGRHSRESIINTMSSIRMFYAANKIIVGREQVETVTPQEQASAKQEPLSEIPNGIGKLCRLSKEIENLAAAFNKAVKEFKEEYDDNMELLRKMSKLRQAAEDVSRKIVKGE